ncbi:hypothetical protein J5N97_024547 [Dioscorea zingiberensis]|uniref:Uncharacterized protein n=1 Tax=Dioscorea zingiberensis TaxID=325984 RepID=A0A9D5C7J8_9LILI|nr:hypothetical protein J5N97_024547 [Dioscorea zingiberensis]
MLNAPTLILYSNSILSLFDTALPSSAVIAYKGDYGDSGDMIRFLHLDDDDNLHAYSSSKGNNVPKACWAAISDHCEVFEIMENKISVGMKSKTKEDFLRVKAEFREPRKTS